MPQPIKDSILKFQAGRFPKAATQPTAANAGIAPQRVISRNGTFGVEQLALDKPTFNNSVQLHVGPEESRLAILDSIKNAKESYWLEIFIWHNDASGQEIAQALIDRKNKAIAEGKPFDAKVLIDWSGLRDSTNSTKDTDILDMLRKGGIDVREFNKGLVDPTSTGGTPITHRKLFIQDGTQYMSGGRNIGDEYLMPTYYNATSQSERSWHDLMFTVTGDETQRIQREFLKNWTRAGGTAPTRLPAAYPTGKPAGNAWVQSFTTDPVAHSKALREAQMKIIRYAQTEIRVVYPYLSDDGLVQALIAAKKANPKLKVQVMMPGKGERGVPGFLYSNLNLETARQLLAVGIEVRFIKQHRVDGQDVEHFSHFKAMVVDQKLMSLGSANGDARTMTQNHELNSLISDKTAAAKLINDVIQPDWEGATRITIQEIDALPFWKKWLMKGLELFDFMF